MIQSSSRRAGLLRLTSPQAPSCLGSNIRVLPASVGSTMMLLSKGTYLALLAAATIDRSLGLAPARKRPVQKVAVIGAGIAGLSVAHSFLNQPGISLDIFDRRPSFDAAASSGGAGIQLNGGLSILGRINPVLRDRVYAAGRPQTKVRSTGKSWKSTEDATTFDTLFEIDVNKLIRTAGTEALLSDDGGRVWWTTVMRNEVQRVMYSALPADAPVKFSKQLVGIRPSAEDQDTAECVFADGSTFGPYDLVIGCEGINSVTRNMVDGMPSSSTDKTAIYSGIRIRYAVSDLDDDDATSASLIQYFGNGAYALNGVYGAGDGGKRTRCIYIVYLDPDTVGPFSKPDQSKKRDRIVEENPDWIEAKKTRLQQEMIAQLERAGICNKELSDTIMRSEHFFELGSYFHSPFGKWSGKVEGSNAWVTLCGDAAHALPPFLGQGSNQAIQDAFCLTQAVQRYNNGVAVEDDISLGDVLSDYERIRWPAIFDNLWKAAILGYLETGGPDGLYSKFRDLLFKFLFMIGFATRVLLSAATPRVD
jgi:salicylate hydroxylase